MSSANRWIGPVVLCLIVAGAGQLLAQDWPQWRGPNRDGKVAGFTVPATWPKALTEKWKVTVGAGDSTPALVGDRLYVFARQGEDEVTICLDAATGKEVWKDKNPVAPITGPSARQHAGPRSSPAMAEGKVVTLGVRGTVSCLNAADGKVLWRKDEYKAVPTFFTASSPIIVDGMAVVQLGGEGGGAIVAYDLGSGDAKWKCAGDGAAYASPVAVTVAGVKQIVTLTDKNVVGVAVADGKILWQLPFAAQRMAYNAATPIVDGQTVIYTGQGRGTKAVKIDKQGDAFAAKELWSNAEAAPQFNTPVLKDGLLYGLSNRGAFFCLDAKTGKTVWTDTGKRGGFGAIIDAGSVLLALPSNSELLVLKPNEKEYAEVAKIKVADSATYAHPIVAGNRIFVKDQTSLAMCTLD